MVVENGKKATHATWKWSIWTLFLYLAFSYSVILIKEFEIPSPNVEEHTGGDVLYILSLVPLYFFYGSCFLSCFVATIWSTLIVIQKKFNDTSDKMLSWGILVFSWCTYVYLGSLNVPPLPKDIYHHDSFISCVYVISLIKGVFLIWNAIVLGETKNRLIRICRIELTAGIGLLAFMGVFYAVATKMHASDHAITIVKILVPDVILGIIINAFVLMHVKHEKTANSTWANPFVPWIYQLTHSKIFEKFFSPIRVMNSSNGLNSKLVKVLVIILVNLLVCGYYAFVFFSLASEGCFHYTALKNHAKKIYVQIQDREEE